MVWATIEPVDLLFFRDSKPYTAGEGYWARGANLPQPQTVAGALRTKLMEEVLNGNIVRFVEYCRGVTSDKTAADLRQRLGDGSSYGELKLTGPFLAKTTPETNEILFPVPRNVVAIREGEHIWFVGALPAQKEIPGLKNSWGEGRLLFVSSEEGGGDAADKWMPVREMAKYLRGGKGAEVGYSTIAADNLYTSVWRTGNKIDTGRKTAADGHLYRAEYLKLKRDLDNGQQTVFAIEIDSPISLREGLMLLGGEGRQAWLKFTAHDLLAGLPDIDETSKNIVANDGRFLLYLASPAVFGGWKPQWIESRLTGQLTGVEFALEAAAVGKPSLCSGWDMINNKPKPLYRAVPAGSVYFCRISNGNCREAAKKIAELFHRSTYLQQMEAVKVQTSYLGELAKIGYGLSFVGTWDYRRETL